MNEISISRYTAAKMIKTYYKYHYFDLVDVKVKSKLENNDLYMIVKIQSTLNHKKIVETKVLNEGEISNVISDYFETMYCEVKNIVFEPYFHNLNIRYDGEFVLEKNKGLMKIKGAM